ncbi:hypothetical protein QU487_22235 [Crenobacter sp. SG2305]|uniref:hypothetical protein n=1 Tax=Crenobacter oryzisoli TaxID=3056844 RepID=UPI0025AAAC17|nr:hypothetical protein [Crenobacter sp. SG2305]MDN0085422.1 hypothetical protein [Crenobacter sp. SG2305]
MSASYFVVYTEPRTFIHGDVERILFNAHVTGHEHTDLDEARRELQALSARITKPLKLIRCLSLDDEERGLLFPPFAHQPVNPSLKEAAA